MWLRVGALLVILTAALAGCRGGGGGGAEVELPPLRPFERELALVLGGIASDAATLRELDLNTDIQQGTLTREQLGDYYEEAEAQTRAEEEFDLEGFNTVLRLLGMIGPEDDLLDIVTNFQSTDVLGFYSPEDKKLVLVAGTASELSLLDEYVLAHEYVHSFQDRRFDLPELDERTEEDDDDDSSTEYGDTIDALVEGDAVLASSLYILREYGEGGFDQIAAESSAPEEIEGPEIPPAFQRYFSFPYDFGATFVRYLYDQGGWDEVDKAYDRPPSTEEQVLHPEKYVQREGAIALKAQDISEELGDGWSRQDSGVFGEYDVYNWLYSNTGDDFGSQLAAAGWGGGRIAVYTEEPDAGGVVLHVSLIWDGGSDAREFYDAFVNVVRGLDPNPAVLDASGQIVGWENGDQAGRAWAQRNSFRMVVATEASDLEAALTALNAPSEIARADYLE